MRLKRRNVFRLCKWNVLRLFFCVFFSQSIYFYGVMGGISLFVVFSRRGDWGE